jgi:hypothetical protein
MSAISESGVVLPPYFLPPISWVATLVALQEAGRNVEIGTGGSFRHQTYLNRAMVVANEAGRSAPLRLSVPAQHSGSAQGESMSEARLATEQPWARTLWRTLRTSYARSPYWPHYAADLERILGQQHSRVLALNLDLIAWLLSSLKVPMPPTEAAAPGVHWRVGEQPAWFRAKPYPQCFGEPFVADASALDLLMNLGPHGYRVLSGAVEASDPAFRNY